MRLIKQLFTATLALAFLPAVALADDPTPGEYQNFNAAIYTRAYEVQKMGNLEWLEQEFAIMQRDLKVSKIYLETHRDMLLVDSETLTKVTEFFRSRGIEVAGGITLTIDERNRFETFCYSNPEHRAWVQKVVEHTARHFDEMILDDFYFTSCKSDIEIEAKGDRSWTDYRLELLNEAAHNIIIKPAKAVNPNVEVVIKYPNWYDDFHGLGFDLETGPQIFDGIYTGTETRDAVRSAQHLQQYHGYQIVRYFNNLRPGYNRGGWVDTGGMRYLDRYAEQLWLTLFAKAPEITLFDFRQLRYPLTEEHRAPWQKLDTSLDFDAVTKPFKKRGGKYSDDLRVSRLAGWSLAKIDPLIAQLGEPRGIKSYKPYHSTGEDFLHNYLGMIGLPIELHPEFPRGADLVLLTEAAKHDPELVAKMQSQLRAGGDVMITSGLLRALGDEIHPIAELEVTERKALVENFMVAGGEILQSGKAMLIPQINYFTNDSWELAWALDGPNGWPMLHDADYSEGQLYVLTIPDNFADLYQLPEAILSRIRQAAMADFPVRIDAPGSVSLFSYSNDTFIGMSFRDQPTEIRIVTPGSVTQLTDLETGEVLAGELVPLDPDGGWRRNPDAGKRIFTTSLNPHSYRAFRSK